ncbi:uncharacterized protein K444DRAFT_202536 [Hyaloscypha bicolor E]|uniref:Uncharacterized protein n=1 Tax=Hyaloscypha bicolor E TaxID=1095630 RepID=A0A2J6SPB7_9HELO|nr:uncharacterized protein K444DRAFT_202536 [Hyaloscypha bicolor E]PMD52616.1 hypothetical protein K444DRAFT_202536 [Hyaloscypha bicolor E]
MNNLGPKTRSNGESEIERVQPGQSNRCADSTPILKGVEIQGYRNQQSRPSACLQESASFTSYTALSSAGRAKCGTSHETSSGRARQRMQNGPKPRNG